jgi:hypothetical protein
MCSWERTTIVQADHSQDKLERRVHPSPSAFFKNGETKDGIYLRDVAFKLCSEECKVERCQCSSLAMPSGRAPSHLNGLQRILESPSIPLACDRPRSAQ